MPFELNSQTIGLTYPKCDVQPQLLLNWLREQHQPYQPNYILVAQEPHQSGDPHLHAAIRVDKPIHTRNERFWDYTVNGVVFHPNVVRPRNFRFWVAYCKKGQKYIEEGNFNCRRGPPGVTQDEVISRATSTTRVEFLIWAGVNKITYAKDIWDGLNSDPGNTITDQTIIKGTIHPPLTDLTFTMEWLGPKALILIGDSGLGKTTWAKTNIPKPCLFVTHIDELKAFRKDYHKSILFDDVSFKHYPIQAQIHLVDFFDPRSIHIRYGTARIPEGTVKFFTCNEDPLNLEHPAIARRIKLVRLITPTMFVR